MLLSLIITKLYFILPTLEVFMNHESTKTYTRCKPQSLSRLQQFHQLSFPIILITHTSQITIIFKLFNIKTTTNKYILCCLFCFHLNLHYTAQLTISHGFVICSFQRTRNNKYNTLQVYRYRYTQGSQTSSFSAGVLLSCFCPLFRELPSLILFFMIFTKN